ncbi:cystatin C (amyloid angiopathy and cerebral hemorrhage) [Pungitius pungitius]|uniref:cystatin C (amyloid angiopathy and cerebral hemorrhage) n=1 Tax=Pungitius pungitius TaxID=134920 RepID=UPI0018880B80|nr:cystatin C (amyloid angiopathy and cerebral hemorrhage) [Pungitius pungitius]
MWKLVFVIIAAAACVGSAVLVGGFQDIAVDDEGARDALNFAVAKHNRGSNDMYLSQVAEVTRVQRQLVAGFKYVITVEMAKSQCRKDHATDKCALQEGSGARAYECKFTVWTRSWLNDIQLLKEEC